MDPGTGLAVFELSLKVAKLCWEYYRQVKNAKSDIERLKEEVDRLKAPLEAAEKLLKRPNGQRLQAAQSLSSVLQDCEAQLRELGTKLETKLEDTLKHGKIHKAMRRLGLRALKWPLESKDVDAIIATLEKHRNELSHALQIDQAAILLDVDQKLDVDQNLALSNLLIATDATLDSYANGNDPCLPGTRVDLLKDIRDWAGDSQGRCIFWLSGMAGTGKSTISRTVAESFAANKEVLSASFFFKRGERNRGSGKMLFKTIAAQLIAKEPALAASVRAAINKDPTVLSKAPREQFEHLIWTPLQSLEGNPANPKTIVLVIDALDECEDDDDVRAIIGLLSPKKPTTDKDTTERTLSSVRLMTFVTSRPEIPIRLGFNTIKGQYRDLILHEIPEPVVEHDITEFLVSKLSEIRNDYNDLPDNDPKLPPDWPGSEIIQTLVQMAVPLFIFAATVCRFINENADPADQLAKILRYWSNAENAKVDKLATTYRPILDQLIPQKTEETKNSILGDFHTVVGSIVLLAEPLSKTSLAGLLGVPKQVINRTLISLHSVLSVPTSAESPVRIFHLSFRDFLINPNERDNNPFRIDERAAHEKIANRCLELLSSGDRLKKNICNLEDGKARAEVNPAFINSYLPAAVRYACLYWVHHLEQSRPEEGKACITDDHQAYIFLKRHFLYWLEALSLLGKISESIAMIRCLQDLTSSRNSAGVTSFLRDASRFILNSRSIIDLSPLQVYSSAMIFAPERSVVRNTFQKDIPDWISALPKVDLEWSACRQTIEGHSSSVEAVAFSLDGKTVASGSGDNTVRLWDAATGEEKQKLEGHSDYVQAVAFSPDGKTVASGSDDKTVRLWDAATGEERQKLEGHSGWVLSVAFSPDGKTVASGSYDETVRLWDATTGEEKQELDFDYTFFSLLFSTDSRHLKTDRGTINLDSGSKEASPSPETSSHSIMFGKDWVTHNGKRVLWLPPDYRPDCMASHYSAFALGYKSGLVKVVQFAFS